MKVEVAVAWLLPAFLAAFLVATAACSNGSMAGQGSGGASGAGVAGGNGGDADLAGGGGRAGSNGAPGGIAGSAGSSVTVLPCDELGAADEWQAIPLPTPPGLTLAQGQGLLTGLVTVDPRRAGVVYLSVGQYPIISGLGLWKSSDCGATWARVATGKNADAINSGVQNFLYFHPTKPGDLFSQSFYGTGGLLKSTNEGIDWEDVTPHNQGAPGFVQDASMDPGDPEHFIATFHADCAAPGVSAACFAETTDGGGSWRLLSGPSEIHGWQEGAAPLLLAGATWLAAYRDGLFHTSDAGATWNKVFGYPGCAGRSAFIHPAGQDYFLGCNEGNGIQRSSDGSTWTKLEGSPQANALILAGNYFYASYTNDYSGHPFYRAPAADPTRWEQILQANSKQGGYSMAYDPDHRLLYVSASTAGLWRVVVP